ncbi:hypothetical protein ACHAWF_008786 [Thalassiosira exigua]
MADKLDVDNDGGDAASSSAADSGPRIVRHRRPQASDDEIQLPWVEKYRPASLEDLVAHEDIVSILTRLIDNDNLPHLLLYGPPGTGKVSESGGSAFLSSDRSIRRCRPSLPGLYFWIVVVIVVVIVNVIAARSPTSGVPLMKRWRCAPSRIAHPPLDVHHSRRRQAHVRLRGRLLLHGPRAQRLRLPRHRRRPERDQGVRGNPAALSQRDQIDHLGRGRRHDERRAVRPASGHREAHEERSILHHLQLREQDHTRAAEPVHAISLRPAEAGADPESARGGGRRGEGELHRGGDPEHIGAERGGHAAGAELAPEHGHVERRRGREERVHDQRGAVAEGRDDGLGVALELGVQGGAREGGEDVLHEGVRADGHLGGPHHDPAGDGPPSRGVGRLARRDERRGASAGVRDRREAAGGVSRGCVHTGSPHNDGEMN